MAHRDRKHTENARGSFYVDEQCIDCDVCRVTAPANFQRVEEKGYSYVFRQPVSAEEHAACEEAMDCCPVEAIGNDGEKLSAVSSQLSAGPGPVSDRSGQRTGEESSAVSREVSSPPYPVAGRRAES